jgi:hypothetical protein
MADRVLNKIVNLGKICKRLITVIFLGFVIRPTADPAYPDAI